MKKTIIALWHTANKGKTETLRNLGLILLNRPASKTLDSNNTTVPSSGDFTIVLQIDEKIIAILSQGDPKTDLKKRLSKIIVKFNPDIIFCSTRTRGETVTDVENFSESHGIVWASTYQVSDKNLEKDFNDLKANHLIE